ncbi:DUF4129 domain-containing protein [Hymenobacter sp. BRD67]|uniref:DUF4129 domain-containing protein n=1 Tax=Hymenobacter sp. BRD67 TaxID=2675877 RepID=UPI0015671299|nr:DUF4129 domain-containing protein [Hymenobacter sp. BRD67]QKG53464.1 DUF4129 domain-containing protein [Hymenobacter sp. BRD67]
MKARADTTTAPPLPADTAPQPVRRPAAARLHELRSQRDFQYTTALGEPEQAGWLARLMAWLWSWLGPLLTTRGGKVAWNTIFYGLLGATLVFAVLKLLQVDLTKAFGRAPRAVPLSYETGQENIHELNFADAITQAEAAGNLRLAVRLGYLQLLKQLTDGNLIAWQPDKTNQAYLRELKASRGALHPAFSKLTQQFEYIWYGEVPLPAPLYQQVRADQYQLGAQLNTNTTSRRFA